MPTVTHSQALADQRKLKKLIERRHPAYEAMLPHWQFLQDTYNGGRQWFKNNIFRYLKEGDKEYQDRVVRAYRFNHTREVVDLVNKYIFKQPALRDTENAPVWTQDFWKSAGCDQQTPIDVFMRKASILASLFGRIFIAVDNNLDADEAGAATVKDVKNADARCYAYMISPINVVDMAFDDDGDLEWALIFEQVRDDGDPFESSGAMIDRYRLWTRADWRLYEVRKQGGKAHIAQINRGDNHLGIVPILVHDHIEATDDFYTSPSMIGDIAYLDRACANYLSNLDAIIQDQTFSQLAMPAQGIMPGDDTYKKLVEMGTKRVFLYDGESGARPEFLSPDPRQAELIITVIRQIINEIYHTLGIAGERTKQDNAMGIDNSSGVAKAYDFERVNALLASKASALGRLERRMLRLVSLWNGLEVNDDDIDRLVAYPENFDVRGLADEFDLAMKLSILNAPIGVKRQQMDILVDKIFPILKDDLRKALKDEVKDWTDAPAMMADGQSQPSSQPTKDPAKPNDPFAKESGKDGETA